MHFLFYCSLCTTCTKINLSIYIYNIPVRCVEVPIFCGVLNPAKFIFCTVLYPTKSIFCGVLYPAKFYFPRSPWSCKVCLLWSPVSLPSGIRFLQAYCKIGPMLGRPTCCVRLASGGPMICLTGKNEVSFRGPWLLVDRPASSTGRGVWGCLHSLSISDRFRLFPLISQVRSYSHTNDNG